MGFYRAFGLLEMGTVPDKTLFDLCVVVVVDLVLLEPARLRFLVGA